MGSTYWFLDPYPVPSHAAFREGYIARSRYDWNVIPLPPRLWRWRMRAAGAALAHRLRTRVQAGDTVLTTSMIDAAQFRGILGTPIQLGLYMHENQLTYARQSRGRTELALRHFHSLMASDGVAFNSYYHLEGFRRAMDHEAGQWPAELDLPQSSELLEAAEVLYPGIDTPSTPIRKTDPPLLLWNHRWCVEKDPRLLEEILSGLDRRGTAFRVAVVGSPNEHPPDVFDRIRRRYAKRLVAWGFQPYDRYKALLSEAHAVLSTAVEENFGIAVLEAVAHGAVPILPDRAVYPEIAATLPAAPPLFRGADDAVATLRDVLHQNDDNRRDALMAQVRKRFDWSSSASALDAWVASFSKAGIVDRPTAFG